MFYAKCCQATSTYTALHDPWSHLISGLWRVSLVEYLLVLRVYFPLLQMALCIMVIARVASIPLWMRSKPRAGFFITPSICFCGLWSYVGTVLNYVGNSTFKLNLLLLLFNQTRFVITLFRTLMMELYLRTLCNMRHIRWIMYDLGCCGSFIETRRGTRQTTGFIWTQVWQRDRLRAAIVLVFL